MNEKTREDIALFRCGLIAPLLNGQMEPKEYFEQLKGKIHQIPYYGERTISAKTIQEWLLHYRRRPGEEPKFRKVDLFRQIHSMELNAWSRNGK